MQLKREVRTVLSIILIAAMVFSLGSFYRADPVAAAEGAEDKTCHLTIDNGAATANTDTAVNGLHVYDPNSEDLEDFVSGAELPLGSTVSVYVYNLVSPVALTIVHNGKTVVEERFEKMRAFEDDDKVKFFEFTLEGDLRVSTLALEEEQEENETRSCTVHLGNANLAAVSWNDRLLKDGDTVLSGEQDFTIQTGERDVALNLTMAGTQREVTLVNPWQNRGVSLEVSRNGQEILSGDKLEAGTPLSVELRNDTPQSVKLLALLGDALTELAKVEAGESRSDERTLDEDILLLVAVEKPDTETAGVYLPDGQAQPLQVCTVDNGEAVADGAVLPTGTPLTISAVSNDVTHVSQKKRRYGMGSFLVGFGAGARRAEAKKPTKNGALSGGLLFGQQFFWALIA